MVPLCGQTVFYDSYIKADTEEEGNHQRNRGH